MPSWTGYYFKVGGLGDLADASNTTQIDVTLVGPFASDDGAEDGVASINGADVTEAFVMLSNATFTIDGIDYTSTTASFGWELDNGEMLFSPDFSGIRNSAIVDALNASGGSVDAVTFSSVFSNTFAMPDQDYSLSSVRYGGPVCFVAGTRIRTPGRERAVETLAVGDWVETLDRGAQRVLWTGTSVFHFAPPGGHHRPILIPAHSLRPAYPWRDLRVSPQHGLLIQDGPAEYLVPAKWLIGRRGIRIMRGQRRVQYHHIMLQTHSLVWAEGLLCESFFPGPRALKRIGAAARAHLTPLLKSTRTSPYGPRARPLCPRPRKRTLIANLTKRQGQATSA